MIAVDICCPDCCHSPVNHLELIDGEIWFCPECGYQELTAGVDIEVQLNVLSDQDPELAAGWRETLGI